MRLQLDTFLGPLIASRFNYDKMLPLYPLKRLCRLLYVNLFTDMFLSALMSLFSNVIQKKQSTFMDFISCLKCCNGTRAGSCCLICVVWECDCFDMNSVWPYVTAKMLNIACLCVWVDTRGLWQVMDCTKYWPRKGGSIVMYVEHTVFSHPLFCQLVWLNLIRVW